MVFGIEAAICNVPYNSFGALQAFLLLCLPTVILAIADTSTRIPVPMGSISVFNSNMVNSVHTSMLTILDNYGPMPGPLWQSAAFNATRRKKSGFM
jgi:hypothetical protein